MVKVLEYDKKEKKKIVILVKSHILIFIKKAFLLVLIPRQKV